MKDNLLRCRDAMGNLKLEWIVRIQALLDRDRCHEELRHLRVETARLTCEQDGKLGDVFELWDFGLLAWERGNEDGELDSKSRMGKDISTHKCYLDFPSGDFCIRSLFLIS